jgi:DNA-binding Lrp family transcriptional regulator
MSPGNVPTWSFLTNHARVLLCIADDPAIRLRDIGEQVGITERAVYRIVDDLVSGGYISRERSGRRNQYTVHRHLPVPDRISRTQAIGELLEVLAPLTRVA